MTKDSGKSPRFTVSILEMLVLVAIPSGLFALLFPAVETARATKGLPPAFPLLQALLGPNPWLLLIGFPSVTTALAGALILWIRAMLPHSVRAHFEWYSLPRVSSPPPEPILDSRPAIAAFMAACTGTVVLILTASHVRADRTHRRPIVTWVGPLADYLQYTAYLGWFLSGLAMFGGFYAIHRFRSKFTPMAVLAAFLGCLNLFGSVVFYAAVYED